MLGGFNAKPLANNYFSTTTNASRERATEGRGIGALRHSGPSDADSIAEALEREKSIKTQLKSTEGEGDTESNPVAGSNQAGKELERNSPSPDTTLGPANVQPKEMTVA